MAMDATSAPGYAARHARSLATNKVVVDPAPNVSKETAQDASAVVSNRSESPTKLVVVSLALDDRVISKTDAALSAAASSQHVGATKVRGSHPKDAESEDKTVRKRKYKTRRSRGGAPPPPPAAPPPPIQPTSSLQPSKLPAAAQNLANRMQREAMSQLRSMRN